jgi:hypothetical protein
MSRRIKLNDDEFLQKTLACIRQQLMGYKGDDGKISVTITLPEAEAKTKILFTPSAYAKMVWLVQHTDTEVGWHGTCERVEGGFLISDIFCYPQTVTGSTVTTNEVKYKEWMDSLPDDVFNKLRFHGHSHVNMPTHPSATDDEYRKGILSQLDDDMFYVFLILNKKGEKSLVVYDLANNIQYSTNDCVMDILLDDGTVGSFVEESGKMVEKATQAYAVKSYAMFPSTQDSAVDNKRAKN